jgi:hypothetical protein
MAENNMSWRDIWKFLQTWEGMASATFAASAAIYYAPKKWLETWDWYMDRFHDYPVYDVIKRRRRVSASYDDGKTLRVGYQDIPHEVSDIAKSLNRSEKSVRESLRRLERRGKATEVHRGWAAWDFKEPDFENDFKEVKRTY